jgi:large subunit ribosomal protein L7/L12
MTDDVKTEEVVEETPATEEVAEVKEEVKAEEPKEEAAAEKPAPSGKFADLIKEIEGLTALELSELVKALEDRFGVSAAAPVAMVAGGAAAGAAAEADEEKANYNVVLKDGGSNKIAVIKAVREVSPELGLVEAKTLVESAPKAVKENVPTEDAKAMKEKLEAAGATVELQ